MEVHQNSLSLSQIAYKNAISALRASAYTKDFPLEKLCFFDIETTGLSADVSSLYLIGCGYISKDEFVIVQWFADDYTSEKDILTSFSSFIKNFDLLIHYNGCGFDIPYLEKKYKAHSITSPFSQIENLDFYRVIRPIKKLLPLENLKLTTVEAFLRIQRRDRFSGKDCIELYSNFMQMKYLGEEEKRNACYHCLLLHNFDDIAGTFLCSQLLLYLTAFSSPVQIENQTNKALTCHVNLPGFLPSAFSYTAGDIPFSFKNDSFTITLPLITETLYFFYRDYKNYFYLPAEDKAIHKSVATYVDAPHRERATAKNCYTKKTGTFLPIPVFQKSKYDWNGIPLFFDLERKHAFIEWEGQLPENYILSCLSQIK